MPSMNFSEVLYFSNSNITKMKGLPIYSYLSCSLTIMLECSPLVCLIKTHYGLAMASWTGLCYCNSKGEVSWNENSVGLQTGSMS